MVEEPLVLNTRTHAHTHAHACVCLFSWRGVSPSVGVCSPWHGVLHVCVWGGPTWHRVVCLWGSTWRVCVCVCVGVCVCRSEVVK